MDDYATTTVISTNTSTDPIFGVLMAIFWVIYFAVIIALIAGYWKTFVKAGKPGWGAIIPIYNTYLMIKIGGKPGWWLLLYFIPIVNLVVLILVSLGVAEKFGKSSAFGIFGLWLFAPIGYLMLGFGDAKYQDAPATTTDAAVPAAKA
jgi:hypothetical protein